MTERTFRTEGELDVEASLDLRSCDSDPIHLTASIQPHGSFLQLDPETREVRSAAANVEQFTEREPAQLMGSRIGSLIGSRGAAALERLAKGTSTSREHLVRELSGRRSLLTIFPVGDTVGLELEPLPGREEAPEELMSDVLVFAERLRRHTDRERLFEATVRAVRSFSDFDRVMLYRFDEEGHGSVVAEDLRPGVVSYRGHRFPASDVPDPARRIYRENRTRYIPRVSYEPVPILGPDGQRDRRELDLTYSSLRGVPAVHRQYLENMGVATSCSFSLVVETELWGLIACHGLEARSLGWIRRSICAQIAQTAAQQLEWIRSEERERRLRAVDRLRDRLDPPTDRGELFSLLRSGQDDLLSLMDARYFLLRLDRDSLWIGPEDGGPPEALVSHISERLADAKADSVRSIVGEVDDSWAHSERIGGYLALRLGSSPRRFCAWFRPEERETIEWGGDPRRPAQPGEGRGLSPRDSFETWTQIVTGRCRAWGELDRVAARELTQFLDELIIEVQGHELRHANRKLEKIAWTDGLTRLANRREVGRRLADELERARRYSTPLTVALLDLDHFKQVNDRHGHQTGDEVLERIGAILREQVRAPDVAGRYGGEEFALVLPETREKEGTALARRILEEIRGLSVSVEDGEIGITCSAGVVSLTDQEEGADELMGRADRALYRAKEEGRDRVVAG